MHDCSSNHNQSKTNVFFSDIFQVKINDNMVTVEFVFRTLSPFIMGLGFVIVLCCLRIRCNFCKPEESSGDQPIPLHFSWSCEEETSRDQPVIRMSAINYTTSQETELTNFSRNPRTQNCQQNLRVTLPQETILTPSQPINNTECDKPPSYESLFPET